MMGHFVILEVLMIALLVIGPHTTIGQTVKAFYKNDLVDVQATCTDFSFGSASWCLSAGGVWTKFSASNPCSNVLYLAECKPVAACSSSPCSNGGTCVNAGLGYQCTCPTGYTGTNCQTLVPCSSSPCSNGGTCVNAEVGYQCICPTGYTGINCQTSTRQSLIGPSGQLVIPDSALTASSSWNGNPTTGPYHTTNRSRLNSQGMYEGYYGGAWSAANVQAGEWIQADLGSSAYVYSIQTQGRNDPKNEWNQWVTQYYVMYGNSTTNLIEYKVNGARKVFNGNSDKDTVVTNSFNPPIVARFVRVVGVAFNNHPSMRWELLGYAG